MVSPTVDRRQGLVGNIPIKAPVTVLADSNVTLSGQQTIDGVAVLAVAATGRPDRVLCTAQDDPTENGIWDVGTAAWSRSLDANGNYDLGEGTTVQVARGNTYAGSYWRISNTGLITIGTTSITWERALASAISTLSFLQAGTGAVSRGALEKMREEVSLADFGGVGDWDGSSGTDNSTAWTRMRNYCRTNNVRGRIGAGRWRFTESPVMGTDAGLFPYSGFDLVGDGAECTEIVLDYDGTKGLDVNPGTGGYTAFANSSIGGFRISVANGRTVNVPLYVKNSYNCNYHDIHIYVPASCADASFIGMRVSGACYFNTFRNIWIENHTGVAHAGSRAYHIGDGLADVALAGANTSVNTFINCRAYDFGVNWDTVYANVTTFINCDAETAITRNWRDLSTIGSSYINCWEEGVTGASFTIDRSAAVSQPDGSTITGSASDQLQIKGGLWGTIEIDYAYHVRIVAPFNSITVTANAEDIEYDNLKDSGTATGSGNEVRGKQRKTSPVVRTVTTIGNRRTGVQFGATAGPAELLLHYSGDDLSVSAYRDGGSSNFKGWQVATDGNGSFKVSQWTTAATLGAESPVELLRANTSGIFSLVTNAPLNDNTTKLGDSANRWSQLYAGTTTISTSDANEKEQVRELTEAERAVAVRLKSMVRAFKFKDAVQAKGDGARIHFGMIAQEVKAAFEAEGLVAQTYGLLCYDEWDDRYEPVTEEVLVPAVDRDGTPFLDAAGQPIVLRERHATGEQRLVMAAGGRYGVRYEELLAFVVAAI